MNGPSAARTVAGRLAIGLLAGALAGVLAGPVAASVARGHPVDNGPPPSPAGAALYLEGVLGSGAPLVADRAQSEPLSGTAAACVNCHRRSGLGATEGRTVVPPVAGEYLFSPPGSDLAYVPGARPDRPPYTDATFARALREGVDAGGRPLSYLMPRYALDDTDMAALAAHLRSLERRRRPGVSSTELHFATIITPDADPVQRQAVLDVLEHFFQDRNAAPRGLPAQTMATSGTTRYAKSMFKVNRRWVLHVWEPTGPASTWTAQLKQKFAAQPVFAVVSGVGGRDWSPVSAFCEEQAVPCLFPNVEAPPLEAERNFYTLYFSRGVLLEADLIGNALLQGREPPPHQVLQIYRAGDSGERAALALAARLKAAGVTVNSHAIAASAPPAAIAGAVRAAGPATLALWLRPADLAALGTAAAPAAPVYVSGLMGGLENTPLPAAWRAVAHLAYPVDLPESRRVRVDYALAWFRIRQIAPTAIYAQADTHLACGLLTETIKHMVDAFVPDYLIERFEDTIDHRIITGYYPRLTLGPHQRFASKGGFLVRFDEASGAHVVAEGPWVAP